MEFPRWTIGGGEFEWCLGSNTDGDDSSLSLICVVGGGLGGHIFHSSRMVLGDREVG